LEIEVGKLAELPDGPCAGNFTSFVAIAARGRFLSLGRRREWRSAVLNFGGLPFCNHD
jgi:hypothetical protein